LQAALLWKMFSPAVTLPEVRGFDETLPLRLLM